MRAGLVCCLMAAMGAALGGAPPPTAAPRRRRRQRPQSPLPPIQRLLPCHRSPRHHCPHLRLLLHPLLPLHRHRRLHRRCHRRYGAHRRPNDPPSLPSGQQIPSLIGLSSCPAGACCQKAVAWTGALRGTEAFGARGDGASDDTAAIQRAIDSANASPGVIFFPPGVYILSRPVTVHRSKVVLRGAGQGLTTIHIPLALGDVYPGTYSESGGTVQTAWNSGGGFLHFSGRRQRSSDAHTLLAVVDSPVAVGSTRIPVRGPARFKVGMRVRIYVNDRSTYDSTADTRRRLLAQEQGGNSTGATSSAAAPVDALLPSSLRFLGDTAPGWVLQDPVVQAALEGARALYTGDKDDNSGSSDAAADAAAAEFGAAAPMPGDADAAGAPELPPGPAAEPAAAPGPAPEPAPGSTAVENKVLIDDSMPLATSTTTVDEDGADVGTVAAWVAAVGPDYILLDRGMPFPIKTAMGWVGLIHLELPSIEDSGIERMTIRFKHTLAGPHHTDRGFNAIQIANAANFWVRNVTILNADTPIYFAWLHRSVIQDVTLSVTAPRSNPQNQYNGHHGICITEGQMNLVTRLRVQSPFIHDITIASSASMNVVQESAGFNLNIDHHRTAPFANLFTNLNMGYATRPFESGGRGDRGAHSGRGNTYWLLRSASGRPLVLPSCDFGPILNFVGPYQGFPCPGKGWMVRPLYTMPPNLYRAQRWKFGRQGPSG
ncbi:hypothetical protein ABPG75_012251 [Micractinium tetrahymenae]